MKSRKDAVLAIRKLTYDLKNRPETWENPTLDRYLDSLAAWLEDSVKKDEKPPSWELIVEMVEAAKIYE